MWWFTFYEGLEEVRLGKHFSTDSFHIAHTRSQLQREREMEGWGKTMQQSHLKQVNSEVNPMILTLWKQTQDGSVKIRVSVEFVKVCAWFKWGQAEGTGSD